MRIQFKNVGFFLLILIIGAVGFSSCTNETWDDHYSIDKQIVSDKNLWEVISTHPELKTFTWALKQTGYDQKLMGDQMYTVWAPLDAATANIDTTDKNIDNLKLAKEYIENHISLYSYSASGTANNKINLLNKKVSIFELIGTDFMFGDTKLVQKNMVTTNGILHVTSERLLFFDNIWELLAKDPRLDSIKSYLYSFDEIIFDENNSIPGDVNEEGETVYLDSAIINSNKMFRILGRLTVEDSSYTAIWPTNAAWIKAYETTKEYFRYAATEQYTADTLQSNNTKLAMVRNLVYSNNMQIRPDTIVTTTRDTFSNPGYLFEGAEMITASNGKAYITDDLKFRHYESWNKEIRVEAEKSKGRVKTYSDIEERTYYGKEFESISGRKYIEVNATTTSIDPTVSFEIPNTLSGKLNEDGTLAYGARYNVYCVFVPEVIKKTPENAKANKVEFAISYLDNNLRKKEITYNNNKENFVSSKFEMTTILVASDVTFPFSEYGLENSSVTFKVKSKVSRNETVEFTKDLLIDCIILEPVQ